MPTDTLHLPKTQLTNAGGKKKKRKRLFGEQYMDLKSLSLAEHTVALFNTRSPLVLSALSPPFTATQVPYLY